MPREVNIDDVVVGSNGVPTAYASKISYLYRADGLKLQKNVYRRNHDLNVFVNQTTDYLTGFQYDNMNSKNGVYQLRFFPHKEGYVNNQLYGYESSPVFTPQYVYNHTDHLGNVRLSYQKNGTSTQIIEENNYYPFGLKHKGYNDNYFPTGYKYKYNGKEFQDELGLNVTSMDFRNYDNAIGRFNVQDPVIHYTLSPYQAFNLNPIFWSDPSGLSGEHYNWETGKYEDDKGNTVSYEDTMASHGMNSSGNPLDDITVNNSGYITNVVKNDKPNRFFDESGNELFFNDPENNDKDNISYSFFQVGDKLFNQIDTKDFIKQILGVSGSEFIRRSTGIFSVFITYPMIGIKSWGEADFTMSFLTKKYNINNPLDEEGIHYFRFENSNKIYELYDAGNFMWGAWSKYIRLYDFEVRKGSNLNEYIQGRNGDTPADQRAIFDGRKYWTTLNINNSLPNF